MNQLEMFRKTTAQIVYGAWLCFMHEEPPLTYHPSKTTRQVAEYFNIDYKLVCRIVDVQSRWDARRLLRKVQPR